MKYIKLFEAFDSNILSKTLKHINKDSRNKFLEKVKAICESKDFPVSKLSDDLFRYLPFNRALEDVYEANPQKCDATSVGQMGQYGVSGEVCDNGVIKRKWGRGIRDTQCPKCKGKGVLKVKPKISRVKFWFTKDGDYIASTVSDGIKREDAGIIKPNHIVTGLPSKYEIDRKVSLTEASNLEEGSYISFTHNGYDCTGYIFIDNNIAYVINDRRSYTHPECNSNLWTKYGGRSLRIGNVGNPTNVDSGFSNIFLYKPYDNTETAYDFNACLYDSSRDPLTINNGDSVKQKLKNAHFAIVMDYNKFEGLEFTTKQDIKDKRRLGQFNSKLDSKMSNESIRKANIDRYINAISNNVDTKDISSCNNIVSKVVLSRYTLYGIMYNESYQILTNIIARYYDILSSSSDSSDSISYLNRRVKEVIQTYFTKIADIRYSIDAIEKYTNKLENNTKNNELIKLFKNIERLNNTISDKIKSFDIQCIEDLEIVNQFISGFKNIAKSDRSNLSNIFAYILEWTYKGSPTRAIDYIERGYIGSEHDYNRYNISIERLIKIVERYKL